MKNNKSNVRLKLDTTAWKLSVATAALENIDINSFVESALNAELNKYKEMDTVSASFLNGGNFDDEALVSAVKERLTKIGQRLMLCELVEKGNKKSRYWYVFDELTNRTIRERVNLKDELIGV